MSVRAGAKIGVLIGTGKGRLVVHGPLVPPSFFVKIGAFACGFPYSLTRLTGRIAGNQSTDCTIVASGNLLLALWRVSRPIVTGSVVSDIPAALRGVETICRWMWRKLLAGSC